jgi:predicted DNA-binding transcriptional regulator YafY
MITKNFTIPLTDEPYVDTTALNRTHAAVYTGNRYLKIVIDSDKELRIELRVKVNYELEEQILKHGQRVRVLEPKSLRKLIKNRLKEALANYKSEKNSEK